MHADTHAHTHSHVRTDIDPLIVIPNRVACSSYYHHYHHHNNYQHHHDNGRFGCVVVQNSNSHMCEHGPKNMLY